jgi:hypothetical protein
MLLQSMDSINTLDSIVVATARPALRILRIHPLVARVFDAGDEDVIREL